MTTTPPEPDGFTGELTVIADGFVTHADGSTSQHPVEARREATP